MVSVLREGYRIPFQHRLTPPPFSQFPSLVSNIPLRLSKSSRPASRGRDHDFEGGLGESPRSESRLLQPLLPGGKGVRRLETCDQPLPFQRVHTTNSFQDGNCLLSPPLASIDLKDAYFQIPVHTSSRKWLRFVWDGTVHQFKVLCFGLSTAPQVFTRVFATVSAWAHTRGGSSSPVPGRLAGPSLYRGQSQAARPGPSIPVQLPRGSTQQREVQPQPVTVGGVPRHDHRHSGCPSLPYSTSHRQIHRHGDKIPIASGTPRPALAGGVGTHVIAGEAGPPRKTRNALAPMASEVTLVPGVRPSQPPSTPVPAGRGGPLLVDGEGPPTLGDTLRNADPRPPSIEATIQIP